MLTGDFSRFLANFWLGAAFISVNIVPVNIADERSRCCWAQVGIFGTYWLGGGGYWAVCAGTELGWVWVCAGSDRAAALFLRPLISRALSATNVLAQ